MLPDFLSNKYAQYKEDTNRFITWLVNTAEGYGYVKPSPITTPTIATPRLKGRARKNAKKAASMPNKRGKEVKGKVSLQDILSLANTIVAGNSRSHPVHVPQYILRRGRNAIKTRRQFVTWYQTQAVDKPSLESNNERHAYFIQVLENALDILTPYVTEPLEEASVPVTRGSNKKVEDQNKSINNMFDNLEMEESSEHDLLGATAIDGNNLVAVEDAPQTSQKELYELESSEAEMRFAIFCLLEDVHHIQDLVIETWKHYKRGEIDLVTASVTTNTAINFVHGAEEQLMASYPQLIEHSKILEALFGSTKNHDLPFEHGLQGGSRPKHADSSPNHRFDTDEYLYMTPYVLLETFIIRVRARPSFTIVSTDRGEKNKEDMEILSDILPEVLLFKTLVLPAEDEFSQGMRQVLSGDVVPLWVVFAYQLYLEIHRTLREQVVRGLQELRIVGTQVRASLKDYFANEKAMLADQWPVYSANKVHELDEIVQDCVEEDAFSKEKKERYSEPLTGDLNRPFHLLSQHPLLCESLLLDIRLRQQDAGIQMANGWGSIICGAHLYNVARQEGYLPTTWVDMEALIAIHSPERIFVGKAPSSSSSSSSVSSLGPYPKHFCLAQGTSVTALAGGHRRNKQFMSKNGTRKIEPESRVSRLLKCLHHLTDKAEFDAQAVSKLLTEVCHKNKRSATTSLLLNQWTQTHKLTNVQLLALVRQTLANEQPMLHFDYVTMHHRCRQLFMGIRDDPDIKLDCSAVSTRIKDFYTSEINLPGVLFSILCQFENGNQGGKAALFAKVGAILKDIVDREGDAEMRKMNLKGKRHDWLAKGL